MHSHDLDNNRWRVVNGGDGCGYCGCCGCYVSVFMCLRLCDSILINAKNDLHVRTRCYKNIFTSSTYVSVRFSFTFCSKFLWLFGVCLLITNSNQMSTYAWFLLICSKIYATIKLFMASVRSTLFLFRYWPRPVSLYFFYPLQFNVVFVWNYNFFFLPFFSFLLYFRWEQKKKNCNYVFSNASLLSANDSPIIWNKLQQNLWMTEKVMIILKLDCTRCSFIVISFKTILYGVNA